jgi:catechol 2,3-dioxygenase-like lactoylglutathione lyase family enzyme
MTIRIKNLDHLVITATNLQATIDFYTKVLGMEHVAFGDNLHSVHFGDQKFNIHYASSNVSPKAKNIVPGSEDFCLIFETSVSHMTQHLQDCGVTVEQGPVMRSGAAGVPQSVYFRDPDGNLVEVTNVIG